jgi:lipid-A-disaccharide synthase
MNLPTILDAADRLADRPEADRPEEDLQKNPHAGYEFLLPVARTLDAAFLTELILAPTETRQAASLQRNIHLVPEALPALFHSRAGIIASGTATVEAALMGTPFVMVYRVSPLTYALGRPRVKVPYFAMVNLIAGQEIVSELVQHKFTAINIVAEIAKVLPDGPARETMLRGLASVRERLKPPTGDQHPADRAAVIILEMLR